MEQQEQYMSYSQPNNTSRYLIGGGIAVGVVILLVVALKFQWALLGKLSPGMIAGLLALFMVLTFLSNSK